MTAARDCSHAAPRRWMGRLAWATVLAMPDSPHPILTRDNILSGELRGLLRARDPSMAFLTDEQLRRSRAGILESHGGGDLWVFAYGSLMYEPECPELVRGRLQGRLQGWHRAFNKVSFARGCAPQEARWRVPHVSATFLTPTRHLSLALGTARGGHIDGLLFRYADPGVIRLLDKREGVGLGRAGDGYQRVQVTVDTEAGPVAAVTYLSNQHSHCSRMSWRSVSSGSTLANSAVFGLRTSIIAPTASDTFLTIVLRRCGSASVGPRSTSSARILTLPIGS